MDLILFLLGLIIGGLISLIITHFYFKKAADEQRAVFDKLSVEVREAILEDQRESLSVKELNQLLKDKIINHEADLRDPLPYKACPHCGSERLKHSTSIDYERDDFYFTIKCEDCDWGTWSQ